MTNFKIHINLWKLSCHRTDTNEWVTEEKHNLTKRHLRGYASYNLYICIYIFVVLIYDDESQNNVAVFLCTGWVSIEWGWIFSMAEDLCTTLSFYFLWESCGLCGIIEDHVSMMGCCLFIYYLSMRVVWWNAIHICSHFKFFHNIKCLSLIKVIYPTLLVLVLNVLHTKHGQYYLVGHPHIRSSSLEPSLSWLKLLCFWD